MISRINVYNPAGFEYVMQAVGVPLRLVRESLESYAGGPCTLWFFDCPSGRCAGSWIGYAARLPGERPFCCATCATCPGCHERWTSDAILRGLAR